MRIRTLLLLAFTITIISLTLFSCGGTSALQVVPIDPIPNSIEIVKEEQISEDIIVHLVHTSDVQGNLFPYDFVNNIEKEYSLMSVYSYVSSLRESGDSLVLLDNGNSLKGEPLVDYYTYIAPDSEHIVPTVYNLLGYDAANVGSHDLEAEESVYLDILKKADFPFLSANIVDSQTLEPLLEPFTIIERGELRIAVLALSSPSLFSPFTYLEELEVAQQWVTYIEQTQNVDAIIGLAQSENIVALGQKVDGFDIILTNNYQGDAITQVKNPSGEMVYILGALESAQSVGHATLTFSFDPIIEHYKVSLIEVENVDMDQWESNPDVISLFSQEFDTMIDWVFSKVGEIEETVSTRDSMFGDSKFVDLLHLVQLAQTGAELSISAPLSNNSTIEKGEVYVQDILKLFTNKEPLCTLNLSGKEIYEILEVSYGNWFNQMSSLNDDLIKFKTDSEGALLYNSRYNRYEEATSFENYYSLANVNYIVDITKAAGRKVTLRTLTDGSPFEMDRIYTVVMDCRRAQKELKQLELSGLSALEAKGRIVDITQMPLPYFIINEFTKVGYIEPTVDNNWLVIPNVWVQRGIKNSYPKLYGDQLNEGI
jgi:2',3'-cyclic-nucleotide 2'-phosphodiesterase/3'-nucleotidase